MNRRDSSARSRSRWKSESCAIALDPVEVRRVGLAELEVAVAAQVVGEEPQTQLERDDLRGVGHETDLRRRHLPAVERKPRATAR